MRPVTTDVTMGSRVGPRGQPAFPLGAQHPTTQSCNFFTASSITMGVWGTMCGSHSQTQSILATVEVKAFRAAACKARLTAKGTYPLSTPACPHAVQHRAIGT